MSDDRIDTVQEARHQREMLGYREDNFLRRKGWKHTSGTPGSFCMWEREIDGRVLLVDKAHALGIQEHLDAMAEPTEESDDSA